jgi:hypothetical protein
VKTISNTRDKNSSAYALPDTTYERTPQPRLRRGMTLKSKIQPHLRCGMILLMSLPLTDASLIRQSPVPTLGNFCQAQMGHFSLAPKLVRGEADADQDPSRVLRVALPTPGQPNLRELSFTPCRLPDGGKSNLLSAVLAIWRCRSHWNGFIYPRQLA